MNNSEISDIEFSGLMDAVGCCEPNPSIAIAVSGGADSMALLLLANSWARANNRKIVALTVNHNLREEAPKEAKQVGSWCDTLNITHKTLNWQHDGDIKRIQETARNARYNLLAGYCKENYIPYLMTAHHAGDQVETMFFRLARGSGVMGLSGMSARTMVDDVVLLRPFLNIQKSRLIMTLRAKKQEWIEDPSNQNELYSRVKIRSQIAKIPNQNDFFNRSLKVINSIGKFRNLLENKIASQMTNIVEWFPEGYAIIKNFEDFSVEMLSLVLQVVSGEAHPPRSEKLERILHKINSADFKKATLGGVILEKSKNGKITIYREAKAVQPEIKLEKNIAQTWDNRFVVKSDQGLTVRTLTSLRNLDKKFRVPNKNTPKAIIKTLPSFWNLEELISVPHIGYMNEKYAENPPKISAEFYSVKPLDKASFFVMNDINNQQQEC